MTVGPDYKAPDKPLPGAWNADLAVGLVADPSPQKILSCWWTVLGDPLLSALMEQARTNNLDVRQAEARLRQARAQRGITNADRYPTASFNASASRSRSSEISGARTTADLFENSLDASWELDLFGKNRRKLEAADAALQASQEDLRDVSVSLFAEVAVNYVDVRSLQLRLALARSNTATRAETCDIARWRHEAGLTTQLDVDQATLSVEQARAAIPTLQTSLELAKHRLAVLLGQPPAALNELLAASAAIPVPPLATAVGVPADVLRQRPDVRAAERRLAAQTAQIGVAEAAKYPSFSLVGIIGLESLDLGDLYSSAASTALGATRAAWTLFDFGRIRQNVVLQTALQEEALSHYESVVLGALEESENALVAYVNQHTRRRSLALAANAAESAFALARDQYTSGLIDFQSILDAQQSLLIVQDQLAGSDGEVTSNLIRLYKALGGGWTPLPKADLTSAQSLGDAP
jgi:NodT family efflux transporter outer membrane factor (OMF) lipoprotein